MIDSKKRILCISDIHGQYDMLCKLIQKARFNPEEDQMIFLGDYCDRGQKSKEVYELVRQMSMEHGAIPLIGNHDEMFLNFLDGDDPFFLQHGGLQTLESYFGTDWNIEDKGILEEIRQFIKKHYAHHIQFIKEMPYFYETDSHIFVHAGIDPDYADWRSAPKEHMIWIRDEFIDAKIQTGKVVIFGHTPCTNMHGKWDIWNGGDKIGIDGGACFGGQINCLEITEGNIGQYSVTREEISLTPCPDCGEKRLFCQECAEY